MGASLALLARRRLRLWLGPGLEAGVLIVAADSRGPGPVARHSFAMANADARLTAELGTGKVLRWLLALDIGVPLRPLQLAAGGTTILGYAGVYAALNVGMSIGRQGGADTRN